MARAKAAGFQQMMLLGAGRLFVGFPFLLEGLLLAGLSAAIGWALIFYAAERIAFAQFEVIYPIMEDVVIFCLVVAFLGGLSGYVGIRRLLR